jgi:hypothetical protein
MNRVPNLFVEVKSDPDKIRVQYNVERNRYLEDKQKMSKLNKRLKNIKSKSKNKK